MPGLWIVLWRPLREIPTGARLALAVLVAPVVVAAEFYVLRLLGLSFETTSVLLPILNLPAAWPLARQLRTMALPSRRTVLLWAIVLVLPLAYLASLMGNPAVRANWGHAWTHTDIVYMLANGELRPEEPYLAGVRLSYPWLAHVDQAVFSHVLGTSPNVAYIWVNVALLFGIIGLTASLVREMGGGVIARATSALWLGFGVNFAGNAWWLLPPDLLRRLPQVWGDGRYTPWLRKFDIFEPTVFGIGLAAALIYVLARPVEGRLRWPTVVLTGVLLLALGMFYPILLPAGAGVVGARLAGGIVVPWVRARVARTNDAPDPDRGVRAAMRLAGVAALALVAALFFVKFITADRGPEAAVGIASVYQMKVKAVTTILVLGPLLVGLLFSWSPIRRHPVAAFTLLGGAAGCAVLHTFFDVYWDSNEYKYIFPAAVCLTPLAALGFAALAERWRAWGRVALVALALILAVPPIVQNVRGSRDAKAPMPVRTDNFAFALGNGDRDAAALDAIRRDTPRQAVLLARRSDIDLVAPAGRATFVPGEDIPMLGMGLTVDHLLKRARGYPAELVDRRRATLLTVLDSAPAPAGRALDDILSEVRRPVVLLADTADTAVASWLPARTGVRLVHDGDGLHAWLIPSSPGRDSEGIR